MLETGLSLAAAIMPVGALLVGWALRERHGRRRLAAELADNRCRAHENWQQATCDPLTGLLNRRGLEEAFARACPPQATRAMLLCDLDGFKGVNDAHGHKRGDEVLCGFASRLRALAGPDADVARLGGDEFVVLVTAVDAHGRAHRLAEAISAIGDDAEAAPGPAMPTSSAGITLGSSATTLDAFLTVSDAAMYDAKRHGDFFRVRHDAADGDVGVNGHVSGQPAPAPRSGAPTFVAAVGVGNIRMLRRSVGQGVSGKLVRGLREQLEADGFLVEVIAPDVIGIAFGARDTGAARAHVERLLRDLTAGGRGSCAPIQLALIAGLAGPMADNDYRSCVEQAERALDEACRRGVRTVVFDEARRAKENADLQLMADLHRAMANGDLALHYQPKLCARSGEIDSVEALVRWTDPGKGTIAPSHFVAVAEETGNIAALTDWVIDRAIADARWLATRGVERRVYVNISAQLISDPSFAASLLDRLAPHAAIIAIEITETAVIAAPEQALAHLNELARAGIRIAIDDYGVGLSSLTYLKQLPATELKLDMSFITNLGNSHRDPIIVRSTIDLAHGLGLRVTAEGVDNPAVQALLTVMGCDLLQGYGISRALPLPEIEALLTSPRTNSANAVSAEALLGIQDLPTAA